jgi:hypothetical protein
MSVLTKKISPPEAGNADEEVKSVSGDIVNTSRDVYNIPLLRFRFSRAASTFAGEHEKRWFARSSYQTEVSQPHALIMLQ